MDFDFKHVNVPFRMQPGLSRLPASSLHLRALDPASAMYQEKREVSRAGAALHCVAGFDPSDALATIRLHGEKAGIRGLGGKHRKLELLVSQDLAVFDAATGTVPWMCVCVPSGWAPEEKLGLSLAGIHAPVADNQELRTAWPFVARLMANGTHWLRHVWTVSPSSRYDQHPWRTATESWPHTKDPADFAHRCYLRAERQTLFPVQRIDGRPCQQAVFAIDVMLEPLTSVVHTRAQARMLHAALESMSAQVLGYKHLEAARAPLLQWLSSVRDRATE